MRPTAAEFLPLAFYPWESRPEHLALDEDEIATALFLADGHLGKAAEMLKVNVGRLKRPIRRSPKLQRLIERLHEPPV